jgi:hypothetical protein
VVGFGVAKTRKAIMARLTGLLLFARLSGAVSQGRKNQAWLAIDRHTWLLSRHASGVQNAQPGRLHGN